MQSENNSSTTKTKHTLVVLSGGQDSTTCLALYQAANPQAEVYAITFNYGQRHQRELQAARDIAQLAGLFRGRHEVLDVGPILQSTSPLVSNQPLETYADYDSMDAIIGNRVEKTFVPMRNALFLVLAANRAVALGATSIVTGVCQEDNANYPDCRASFISLQQETINQALGFARNDPGWLEIQAPLISTSKASSIRAMSVAGCLHWLAFTHTAYDGQYPPIGRDHASVLRAHGFEEAGIPDPLMLRAEMEGLCALPDTANYTNEFYNEELRNAIRSAQSDLRYGQADQLTHCDLCSPAALL